MSVQPTPRGRPRGFDTEDILDRSIDVFWERGFAGTTTRSLEQALGISQSSLYNAFGSKEQLFDEVVARYEKRLDAAVLSLLDRPDADRDALLDFLDAVVAWIQHDGHRGCLVLNLAAESDEGAARVTAYRATLRSLVAPAIASFTSDEEDVEARTELLVAAILGLNISARGGADDAELGRLAAGIEHQVRAW